MKVILMKPNIVLTERRILHLQVLLEFCYIYMKNSQRQNWNYIFIKKVSFKLWSRSSCISGICLFKIGQIYTIKIVNKPWIIPWNNTIYTTELKVRAIYTFLTFLTTSIHHLCIMLTFLTFNHLCIRLTFLAF
jgi:hypothetical protein